jgi:hypothetical protein
MTTVEAGQPELPVDLLEEILLRLDDAADLMRASAACTSFCHLIAGDRFLRRFRSLHRPPVVGILVGCSICTTGPSAFCPAEPPSRSAPAASALARAADFACSFLVDDAGYGTAKYWNIRDACDGRLLLYRREPDSWHSFEHLMVYDPLHHRRVMVPPIPHDLLTATVMPRVRQLQQFVPFLVPAAIKEKDDDDDDSSFRVVCLVAYSEDKIETFVYSSITGVWRGVASFNIASYEPMRVPTRSLQRHYARGCFYWTSWWQDKGVTVVLDMREMKFSIVNLPPGIEGRRKAIVEAMEDRVGLLVLGENMVDVYSMARQGDNGGGGGATDWRHDSVIPLCDDYLWSFPDDGVAAEGRALLVGYTRDQCQQVSKEYCFTVDLETLLVALRSYVCWKPMFTLISSMQAFHHRLRHQAYKNMVLIICYAHLFFC